jgi:hypothetical protein
LLHSFFASVFTRGEKLLSDFVAGPEVHLIRGLPFECRMGHYSEASLPPIVRFDVELDEATKRGEGI